jgi:hypothetical protein
LFELLFRPTARPNASEWNNNILAAGCADISAKSSWPVVSPIKRMPKSAEGGGIGGFHAAHVASGGV